MHKTTAYIRHGSVSGFSLIEVMIALFVFALLAIIFSSTLIVAKSASTMNGQYAQAISIAQHKIDQLRAMGYGRLVYIELQEANRVDTTHTSSPYVFNGVDTVANYLPNPSTSLRIENSDEYDSTRVKLVTVTVSWRATPTSTVDSSVTLRAYIAKG